MSSTGSDSIVIYSEFGRPAVRSSWWLRCRTYCRWQVPARGGKHSSPPPECPRQGRACTLSSPPPRTVELPQSLLHQSELHGGSVADHIAGAWSEGGKHSPPECPRQGRARTLSPPPPPRTVEQPQACSINQPELMAALLQRQTTRSCLVVGAIVITASGFSPPADHVQTRHGDGRGAEHWSSIAATRWVCSATSVNCRMACGAGGLADLDHDGSTILEANRRSAFGLKMLIANLKT